MHKDRFKGVSSFEDDLYTGMSNDSSKFLWPGSLGTEMKTFFLTSRPVSEFMMRGGDFFSGSLVIQSGKLFLGKKYGGNQFL